MYWLISLLLACSINATVGDTALNTNYTNYTANRFIEKTIVQDETERFQQTYPFNSDGRISISDINGSIEIEAWDSPQIQLEYTKVSNRRERLADIDVKIDASLDNFEVKTKYNKNGENWNWGSNEKFYVKFKLKVPRSAILDKIKTVNGEMSIEGMSNQVNASTVNGGITAKNLRGVVMISSVNGTVNAELIELGNEVKLSTVNGTVNLYLPSSVDATFKASTVNGSIRNDFGLEVVKKKYGSGSSLNATLGSGNSQVRLSSVNGTVDIKRGSAL